MTGACVTRRDAIVGAVIAGAAAIAAPPLVFARTDSLLVTHLHAREGRVFASSMTRRGWTVASADWRQLAGIPTFPEAIDGIRHAALFLPSSTCFVFAALFAERGFATQLRVAPGRPFGRLIAQGDHRAVDLARQIEGEVSDWNALCSELACAVVAERDFAHRPDTIASGTHSSGHFELRLLKQIEGRVA